MKIKSKKFVLVCSSAVTVALVAVVGITALGKNEDIGECVTSSVTDSVEYEITHFRKASLSEYDMSPDAQRLVTKQAKTKKAEIKSFSVGIPDDQTVVYECEPDPLEFYETRDISDEFYTVYDENAEENVTLDAFDLVCRIVNNEIGDSWNNEAIKAQAVAAYNYVRFNDEIGNTASVGLKSGYSAIIEDCVRAVSGQALYCNGEIINAVYSASTAGFTTNSADVWGTGFIYLRAVVSPFDENDPYYGLETVLTKEQVKSVVESQTDIKLSDNVQEWFGIESVYSRKYIADMTIDGYSNCRINGKYSRITGRMIQNLFGLKNSAFDVRYEDGSFVFTTYGWGHGVGMSQWGAKLYAEAGYTYDQILRHYYLETVLSLSSVNERAVERGKTPQTEENTDVSSLQESKTDSVSEISDSSLEE